MSWRNATGWLVAFAALVFLAYSQIEAEDDSPQNSPTSPGKKSTAQVLRVVDGDTILVRANGSGGDKGRTIRVRYIGRLSRFSGGGAAGSKDQKNSRSGGDGSDVTAIDTVSRVSDGDTVVLKHVGKTRLIGVDTPEVFGQAECFGAQASAFTNRLLPAGMKVRLWADREPQDRYGRILLYLQLMDGRFVNDLLVSNGMAVTLTIPPNVHRAEHLRKLAATARSQRRGLWSPRTCGGNPDLPARGGRD